MKVGVLLPSRFEDPGELLADARAMEAARADSVWLEEGDGHDPMLVLAAIAAVTDRLRLGLIRGSTPRPNLELDRRIETHEHLTRHRVITFLPLVADGQGGGLSGPERWRRVEVPGDSQDWAKRVLDGQPEVAGEM